jgi:hypothetical protein
MTEESRTKEQMNRQKGIDMRGKNRIGNAIGESM